MNYIKQHTFGLGLAQVAGTNDSSYGYQQISGEVNNLFISLRHPLGIATGLRPSKLKVPGNLV